MGVNYKALARIPGMFRAGQEAGYRREQRENMREDRAYKDRLIEASEIIATRRGWTGDEILALAKEHEVNPMDLHQVLTDYKKFRSEGMKMDEFTAAAGDRAVTREQTMRTNELTMEANEEAARKSELAGDLMSDVQAATGGGGMGGLSRAGMPTNPAEEGRDAGIAQRSPRDLANSLVQRGVEADVSLPKLGALAETLGLPKTEGVGPSTKIPKPSGRTVFMPDGTSRSTKSEEETAQLMAQGGSLNKPVKPPSFAGAIKQIAVTDDGKYSPQKYKAMSTWAQDYVSNNPTKTAEQVQQFTQKKYDLIHSLPKRMKGKGSDLSLIHI